MPRSGTLVICVQNLDFSGANQVILNIVQGRMHESNVIVLSPKSGLFAARLIDTGAAVRIGHIATLLDDIRDVFCIICNTIMTADIVADMSNRPFPIVWIIHEWWTNEMIIENLEMRHMDNLTVATVQLALSVASIIVFVSEKQRQLYKPMAPSTVIYVGVPPPPPFYMDKRDVEKSKSFNILVLGIICPRKNQILAAKIFKAFSENKDDVKLIIVGARYTRQYEISYLTKLKEETADNSCIEIHDVTSNVDEYYSQASCLLLSSTNEVTPVVIPEAMSRGIPVIATDIGGITEMFDQGVEGYFFQPERFDKAVQYLEDIYSNDELYIRMSTAGKKRYSKMFDIDNMVDRYRELLFNVATPTVLVDMDGTLVDWDAGFERKWRNRGPLQREKSFFMEDCVENSHYKDAQEIYMCKGFFEDLPPMENGIETIKEMGAMGLKVYLCSAPIFTSAYCAQEKINWVTKYLGSDWHNRLILCSDKTTVRGDLLIDDKPYEYLNPGGRHTTATWKQVIFDAPYNQNVSIPRLAKWSQWKEVILPLLGKSQKIDPYLKEYGECLVTRKPRLSPRSIRERDKKLATFHELTAQQDCFLGPVNGKLQPEDIASVAGSFSFYVDNIPFDLQDDDKSKTQTATNPFTSNNNESSHFDHQSKESKDTNSLSNFPMDAYLTSQEIMQLRQSYRKLRVEAPKQNTKQD